jgi:hypothetical protein
LPQALHSRAACFSGKKTVYDPRRKCAVNGRRRRGITGRVKSRGRENRARLKTRRERRRERVVKRVERERRRKK